MWFCVIGFLIVAVWIAVKINRAIERWDKEFYGSTKDGRGGGARDMSIYDPNYNHYDWM